MIDIFSLSTNELVAKMREGQISSVEVCKAYIERINKFEKDVKAWDFLDKKILLEKAEEADDYRKSGKPLGPLHGLPIAVKDIFGTYDMLIALNLQTSFLTPPMAMSAYYLKGVQSKNVELMQIFAGIMPFLGIVIFAMVLMYWFPGIALWLPDTLFAD